MMKFYTTLLCIMVLFGVKAQTFQLFTEDFNLPTATFTLNTAGPAGVASGTNKWIINNSYTGGFGYPNTTTQDLTARTIGGAPTSNYLHIYDEEGAPAITCASYDPTDPSDNFAEMSGGFYALGLIDIEYTFFGYVKVVQATTDKCITVPMEDPGHPWEWLCIADKLYGNMK